MKNKATDSAISITKYMYMFILSLSSPVYLVEMLYFVVFVYCDSTQPAELPW